MIRSFAIGLAATTCAFGMAQAQDTEIGSRLKRRDMASIVHSPHEAAVEVQQLAECMVHRRPGEARSYLDAIVPAEVVKARKTLYRDLTCTPGSKASAQADATRYSVPVEVMRGLLAEALIHRDYSDTTPAAQPLGRVYASSWANAAGRSPIVEEMAVCVAAINPAGIVGLLRTEADSLPERQALKRIMPGIGQCLTANAKLSADVPSLRAALAEELYHRLSTPIEAGAPH